jgi:putative hydrolase of the HAD superfamily
VGGSPALLIDYGGVLTASVFEHFSDACTDLGVDPRPFISECFGSDPESPFARLELGSIGHDDFCDLITPLLTRHASGPVCGQDWMARVETITWDVDQAMLAAVEQLIDRGVPTVLVSNSWGSVDTYPWDVLPKFTDTLVSSVVKLRKPDPRVYPLAAERAGRSPDACVFIDDVESNLGPARSLGMRTILHTSAADTIAELDRIYD